MFPPVILFAAVLTTNGELPKSASKTYSSDLLLGFQISQYSDDYYYEHYDQEYGDMEEEVS